jgi:hypothetical protein
MAALAIAAISMAAALYSSAASVAAPIGPVDAAPVKMMPPAPKLWVTPLSLDFGPVGVGFTAPTQMVTITNLGTYTLTNFAGGGVNPPFSGTQDCAGGVAPGGDCHYYFRFSPTATGTFTTSSSSGTNAGPFSIALRGTGIGPALSVSPLSLDFGYVSTSTTSAQQIVTIRNTGASTLTNFAGGGVYAPFNASQNCAGGVAPGASCQYFFTFAPTTTGSFSATSNSGTNAGPFTIALRGVGRVSLLTGGQKVTPRAVDFGPVGVSYKSGPQVVTITNQSILSTITDWSGGGVSAPFSAQQNCVSGLDPGASCQFYYYFSPTATGSFTAVSSVGNSFGGFTVELRGQGVGGALWVTPLSLDFGPVPVGNTSVPQTVTLRNTGMSTVTAFAGGGTAAPFNVQQTCAAGLPPGQSCIYRATFAPVSLGRYHATSSSSTNAGPFSFDLWGGELLRVYLPLVARQAAGN